MKPVSLELLTQIITENAVRLPCPSSYGLIERDPPGKCLNRQRKQGAAFVCYGCWKEALECGNKKYGDEADV